ncbi:hypothetical protein ACFSL6_10760 [Paenibacillus thailandensis]|uniref:Uncharacterized protein n=1 Tax=Paenibacillus thailandensis TaxID=393250 RepID=A0ABW5R0E6_9BACL
MRYSPVWTILGVAGAAALMLWVDYRELKDPKQKTAYSILYAGALLLAVALLLYPSLPGPSQFNRFLFNPLSEMLLPKNDQ